MTIGAAAQDAKGERALSPTGELRGAITYATAFVGEAGDSGLLRCACDVVGLTTAIVVVAGVKP